MLVLPAPLLAPSETRFTFWRDGVLRAPRSKDEQRAARLIRCTHRGGSNPAARSVDIAASLFLGVSTPFPTSSDLWDAEWVAPHTCLL